MASRVVWLATYPDRLEIVGKKRLQDLILSEAGANMELVGALLDPLSRSSPRDLEHVLNHV